MYKKTIYIIASIAFAFALGTFEAYSQSNSDEQLIAEASSAGTADAEDVQETQVTTGLNAVMIPGPGVKLPFPSAPPPEMGKSGLCAFLINDGPAEVEFTVQDAQDRKLIIKGADDMTSPQPSSPPFVYNLTVRAKETAVYFIALENETPTSDPLELVFNSESGEVYLLKIKNE